MSEERGGGAGTIILALLAGAAAGAAAALLLAPRSGKETRAQLRRWLDEATEGAGPVRDAVDHVARAAREAWQRASEGS